MLLGGRLQESHALTARLQARDRVLSIGRPLPLVPKAKQQILLRMVLSTTGRATGISHVMFKLSQQVLQRRLGLLGPGRLIGRTPFIERSLAQGCL